MKKILGFSALVITALTASSSVFAETQSDVIVSNVDEVTCEQFLELDEETMPLTVGYLYAVNADDSDADLIEIQDLVNVEVASIVQECTVIPAVKLVEVVNSHVAEKARVSGQVEMVM
ncbi:HdeA/HdeB family chaperone [Vibrio superstes]|uniref:Acid stress chaperone HdeA n=1 Tax=Vibrio superstes NBRC 103154 TaxID=1219062 RepID=A0A511QR30_9VIBR|nr:HdeA/HdeB family chaperone [Vibrio superstes]GEM79798.1 hypothetical protein VSU01S_20430 [Vibrio superstes NBRC 103154]